MRKAVLGMAASAALAWPGLPAAGAEADFGGDLRLRYELSDRLPDSAHGEKGHSDCFRVRARVWGRVTAGRLTAFVRVADEFRHYNSPARDKGRQRFPDVLFLDSLYLLCEGPYDGMDVKIGRQDLAFGAKRIISDGTGGDVSRSAYFDAARVTFDFGNRRTLDALAICLPRHDWLPHLGRTHDGKEKGTPGYDYENSGYNHAEYGAALYWQDRSADAFGWDAYYVCKVEDGEQSRAIAASGLDRDSFRTHTFGARLLPRFSETVSGEAELALQTGTGSLFAAMAYGGLTYAPEWLWKPRLTAALLYLSGDRDGWRGSHAWHPVFNRDAGIGNALVPMYEGCAYTNFLYPHLRLEAAPSVCQTAAVQAGPVFAPAAERGGEAGGTYGHFRGYFVQGEYRIALGSFSGALRGMTLTFLGELLAKGDYFRRDADGVALFGRIELACLF